MSTYHTGPDRTPARRAVPVLIALGLLLVIGWLLVAIDRQDHQRQAQPSAPGRPGPSTLSIPNRPLLRLITCTGSFDHATRHYRDNLILYASPTGS